MTAYAVINLETVLARESASLPFQEREASPVGIRLYNALFAQYNLILQHNQDEEIAKHWLQIQGFAKWTLLHKNPPLEAFMHLRNTHSSIDLWLTGDPPTGRALLREGINVLLLSQAGYPRREWRPDYERVLKPWDAIEDEIKRERLVRDSDDRLQEERTGRFE